MAHKIITRKAFNIQELIVILLYVIEKHGRHVEWYGIDDGSVVVVDNKGDTVAVIDSVNFLANNTHEEEG